MLSFQTGKIPKRVRDDIKHFGWHKEQIVIRNFEFSVTCHPELVSGSYQLGIYVFSWENTEILFEYLGCGFQPNRIARKKRR